MPGGRNSAGREKRGRRSAEQGDRAGRAGRRIEEEAALIAAEREAVERDAPPSSSGS